MKKVKRNKKDKSLNLISELSDFQNDASVDVKLNNSKEHELPNFTKYLRWSLLMTSNPNYQILQ